MVSPIHRRHGSQFAPSRRVTQSGADGRALALSAANFGGGEAPPMVNGVLAHTVGSLQFLIAARIDGASCFAIVRAPIRTIRMRFATVAPQPGPPSVDLDGMAAKAREAAHFLKALAHESRLKILCLLCESEKSVSELEQMLALRQPTVSQQLARLRTDGLVTTRRDGKTVYYRLASDETRVIIEAVHKVFCRGEIQN
jgi:DNA-binding transcriptional ArsR family regulator